MDFQIKTFLALERGNHVLAIIGGAVATQGLIHIFNKVINEPDFLPLHVVRTLAQAATLVRVQGGKLVTVWPETYAAAKPALPFR